METYQTTYSARTAKAKRRSARSERSSLTGWLLGITRATLYAKVKQYNIEKGSYVAKGLQNEVLTPSLPQLVTMS